MKKIYHILFILLLNSSLLHAQENEISITNFTVKNELPPSIGEWGNTPGALLLVAQNNTWGDRPVKLLIALRKGDSKICGIADGIALDYFKTGSFQTKDMLAALGNCEALTPGDYTLCASFRGMSDNRQWVDISAEICKPFTVGGGSSDNQKYTGPSIIAPANNKVIAEKEANAPITFRWTPVVPKPKEPVTYRLKVWQLMQGQTGAQAMKVNQTIVEKNVENLTQTNITSGLFPCSPNCRFVWAVQATNSESKPFGENNGMSDIAQIYFDNDGQNKTSNLTKTSNKINSVGNINNSQNRQDPNIDPSTWNDPNSCAYITPWYTGGNSNPLNSTAGTCTNQDFILKANDNKALWVKTNSNIGIGTEYPNRKFSVNGDVSIGLGYSNAGIGGNGIEILGGGQVPTRRGISTDADPNGHFDFFINGWQSANGIPEFRFKNGILNNGNAGNSAIAPDLMRIDGLGRITINNSNTTLTDKAFTIVNNTNPVLPFDYFTVNGDGRTVINSTNATPFKLWDGPGGTYNYEFKQSGGKLGIWTLNSLFSYGFGIDNSAVGHIWADVNQKHQVINFKMGSFGSSQVWIGDKQPIGTHSNYRLAVKGKLVAQSLYITAATQANWADYVFDDNYKLPNLYDIESYYTKNNHLPEIPSAEEVVEKGINVGEMNALLLKKIEELTILMVKQQREIDELKSKVN
ncbi:hypothetical protein [Limnovirga soli]|uniref:Fibronectin type-III domain-containing protein n=1 Tax=Limnovirga soli TaxID=2656915 RepID=A0A8J8JQT0_9BACT|nr:hypothetical protein [Limnovirga soli]NNV55067.1 hypothetical protein [Limnovirga soli]